MNEIKVAAMLAPILARVRSSKPLGLGELAILESILAYLSATWDACAKVRLAVGNVAGLTDTVTRRDSPDLGRICEFDLELGRIALGMDCVKQAIRSRKRVNGYDRHRIPVLHPERDDARALMQVSTPT